MQVPDDADVVRRLAGDDPAALEDAYARYAGRCRAVAFRTLGDDALAQDAVQEAFVALWRHRTGLVVRAAGIGPWLVVVTRNAALNMSRAGIRRAAREEAATPLQAVVDPADLAVNSIESTGLRGAVMDLPEEQRRVIAMAYFHGHTMSQIAASTNTPLGTVKRRAQLALAQLGRALGDPAS